MQIIPVIDLKNGLVVHAVRGDRAHYQPIHRHSSLTTTSHIADVLAGFLKLYPFKRFYIADLDAISGAGDQLPLINSVLDAHPEIDFWLDDGRQLSEVKPYKPNLKWVIGTESQQSPPCASQPDFILSLDYKNEQATGLSSWFSQTQFWPNTVIMMTLSRVGSNCGPDFDKLIHFRQTYPNRNVVAAGGIRHLGDLVKLKNIGVQAALIATALHSGSISKQNIQNL